MIDDLAQPGLVVEGDHIPWDDVGGGEQQRSPGACPLDRGDGRCVCRRGGEDEADALDASVDHREALCLDPVPVPVDVGEEQAVAERARPVLGAAHDRRCTAALVMEGTMSPITLVDLPRRPRAREDEQARPGRRPARGSPERGRTCGH